MRRVGVWKSLVNWLLFCPASRWRNSVLPFPWFIGESALLRGVISCNPGYGKTSRNGDLESPTEA